MERSFVTTTPQARGVGKRPRKFVRQTNMAKRQENAKGRMWVLPKAAKSCKASEYQEAKIGQRWQQAGVLGP